MSLRHVVLTHDDAGLLAAVDIPALQNNLAPLRIELVDVSRLLQRTMLSADFATHQPAPSPRAYTARYVDFQRFHAVFRGQAPQQPTAILMFERRGCCRWLVVAVTSS